MELFVMMSVAFTLSCFTGVTLVENL